MYPMIRWNDTHHTKSWIRRNDKGCFIEPKEEKNQLIEKLSLLLAPSKALFIIVDIIANKSLGK